MAAIRGTGHWHYAWALCPASVAMCAEARNVGSLHPIVQENMILQDLAPLVLPFVPWQIDESTGKVGKSIGQLRIAPIMREVFDLWAQYAAETDATRQPDLALKHLMVMARHEQGEILQGLTYSQLLFRANLWEIEQLRKYVDVDKHVGMFRLQLSFTADEYADDPEWRSDAPKEIQLDDYKQRMDWIGDVAKNYHRLMCGKHQPAMLAQIYALAEHEG